MAARLQRGEVPENRQFDALYPVSVRAMSASYWTPLRVALRAVQWLVDRPGARVLDVGAAAGKLCGVGAVATTGVFHGVEQRGDLVQVARTMAELLGTDRATFTQGLFDSLSPAAYDAFYLFNPFEENEDRTLAAADRNTTDGDDWFAGDVARAQTFLRGATPGARVVTYNGMGGPLPAEYELQQREIFRRPLELWIKRR